MSEEPQNSGVSGRNEKGQFVKGHAKLGGNVKGTFSLVAILKTELQKCPEGEDEKTFAYLLIRKMLKSAVQEGSDQQIKNILQYVEGMPKQPIEHSGKLSLTEFLDDENNKGENQE